MSGPLACASPRRLQADSAAAARGVATTLAKVGRAVAPYGWTEPVADRCGWVRERPVLTKGPGWEAALAKATDAETPDGPEPAKRETGRRQRPSARREPAGKQRRTSAPDPAPAQEHRQEAATAPPEPRRKAAKAPPETAPASHDPLCAVSADPAAKSPSADAACALPPRVATQRLAALAGDAPGKAPTAPARKRPTTKTPPAKTKPAGRRPPSAQTPAWQDKLAAQALDRAGATPGAAAGEAAPGPWTTPLDGDRCGRPLLERCLAAPDKTPDRPTRSGFTSPPGPPGQPPIAAPWSPTSSGRREAGPDDAKHVDHDRSAPAEAHRPTMQPRPRTSEAPSRFRALESDALFESLLSGGPATSLMPPLATPEPDVAPVGSSLRPHQTGADETQPTRAAAPVVAQFGPGHPDVATPPPADPLPDMADAIARVLADEARRHGIDVGTED